MLQIQVRTVSDDGSIVASSRVLDTHNITYTSPFSASATLEFSVSRTDFVPAQFPFLVCVEYAVNGGEFTRVPYEDLFVVEQDSDDSKDLGQVVTYQAQAFVPWLLAGAYVGTGPFEKDGQRTIDFDGQGRASSGHIMKYFIDESKSRGWLPVLNYTFLVDTDSHGVNWNMDARAGISWRLETFYTQVLEQLTTQGFCDWTTSGNKLNMYNPGTWGTDCTEKVVLGGQDFERVPVKTDMTGWYTHVIAVSDAGRVHVQNTAAEARFGRRSIAMTQSGIKDVPTSTKLANELLKDGLKTKREESYRWTPEQNQVKPWADFNNGDLVTAKSRGGEQKLRVIGITVSQANKSYAEVEAKVGEKISTLAAKNRKKLDSVAVGGVAGGSGDAFPSNPGPSPLAPAKPVGLRITSNTGEWASDGITALSNVGLEWDAVTADVDGGEITIVEYEVWSRLPASTPSFDTATNTNSVMTTNLRPGEERLLSVRARSQAGAWSDWSNELSVTPALPGSIVPEIPDNVIVISNTASFLPEGPRSAIVIGWDAVTQTTSGLPLVVEEYELWVDGIPVLRTTELTASLLWPSGTSGFIRVRAKSAQGFWGGLSPDLEVSSNTPGTGTSVPSDPEVTTGYGNIIVRWDGTYTGTSAPGDFSVWVEARFVGAIEWLRQGTAITHDGSVTFQLGGVGANVEVRLIAYDVLGRETGYSGTVQVVVAEIDGADLIAGSVHANRITAGTIDVDRLVNNIGDNLDIAGNESVTIMAGRLDDAEGSINETQSVFVVTPNGAEVRLVDSSSITRISPNGISFVQNGNTPTSWSTTKFTIEEIDARTKARLGNHVFEVAGAGRTIVRPV